MKSFLSKLSKSKIFWISLIIVIQTIIYVIAGMGKAYIHMDESYSLALSNYNKIQIQENDDFYNQWHDSDYYNDYLVVNDDERWDLTPVYVNQRDDVHPPLFYLLLRIGMEFTPGQFSKWTGIIINIVAFAISSIFLYLIVYKLLHKEQHREFKTFVLTLAASITLAAISTVMYIRMYAMLTMFVTITAYLHLLLNDSEKPRPGLIVAISITALLGVLTQYYYLFFLVPVFVATAVRYFKAKRYREFWYYFGGLAIAAIISLIIWPYSIQHLFFGYRGQGAMGNLLNFTHMGTQVGIFAGILTLYDFHGMLPLLFIAMFALAIIGLRRRKALDIPERTSKYYTTLLWPTLTFFVLAAVASPFTDLRYLEAICGLMYIIVMLGLYWLLRIFWTPQRSSIIMAVIIAIVAILPVPLQLEPDVEYSRWAEVVKEVEEKHDIPAIYLFNPGNNRFLDDILLFTKLDQSYVMQDQPYTEATFQSIFKGIDLSDGLFVFSNYGYGSENDTYLKSLEEATGLTDQRYVFQLNSGALYYLSRPQK